jgi:hypothetical protein
MASSIPQLTIVLDFGGSGTKVAASLDNSPIYFLMPPHCAEISQDDCKSEDFNENSIWFCCGDSCYAVGLLAEQASGKSIKIKPLKVESAPIKTIAAIIIAASKLGLGKKILLSLSILLPSGETQQSNLYKKDLDQLLLQKITSPFGAIQLKVRLFKADFEGKGILLYHRQETRSVRNTMVLMLGYRNASFIATQGKIIVSKHCSDIGFHNFLQKIVSLTSGYSLEHLLLPVTRYGSSKDELHLAPCLRFSPGNSHRFQELEDLKKAIDQAEDFYIRQLIDWLTEFLSAKVDEVVMAGGAAAYIGYLLANKLSGTIAPNKKVIYLYENESLPSEISIIKDGDRFLDIYGIWHQISAV